MEKENFSLYVEYLDNLPGEIQGLFEHDQHLTGYSARTILIQSLFFHYPDIYTEIGVDLCYFLLLDQDTMRSLRESAQLIDQVPTQYLIDLLELGSFEQTSSGFPSPSEFLSLLSSHPHFTDFSEDRRITVLLQKLILQYHLMLQPEDLIGSAIGGNPGWFEVIHLELSFQQAVELLKTTSFTVYNIRRSDYEIRQRIRDRFQLLSGLRREI